jgi:hypothetical protein
VSKNIKDPEEYNTIKFEIYLWPRDTADKNRYRQYGRITCVNTRKKREPFSTLPQLLEFIIKETAKVEKKKGFRSKPTNTEKRALKKLKNKRQINDQLIRRI